MRKVWLLLLYLASTASMCNQGGDLLAGLNYTPLTPPTNLLLPGAVLAVEEEVVGGQKREKFQMSCGPRSSLGSNAQIAASSTISQSFSSKNKYSWKLDAAALAQFGMDVDHTSVKSITATITNAKILTLSDADVLANLPHRSDACRNAIKQRLQNNFKMTMVSSALVADMVWSIEWKEEGAVQANAKDRILELQKLAASIGGGYSRITQKSIESRQIALGIRTDAFLLALTVPEMDTSGQQVVEQAKAEQIENLKPMRAEVSSPDSPYTLPIGGTYVSPEISFED